MGHLEVIGGKGIIPDGATELDHAFFDSTCLESIKIPNSVIEINRHAFVR